MGASGKGEKWMNQVHYFRSDLRRLIKNYPTWLAVLGVAAALWFSLENNAFQKEMVNGNVLDTYIMSTNMSGVMIAYAFCAFSYAAVFCEDLENKYARYSINRGNTWRYVASKSVVIYGSSVLTMVLGTFLFVVCIRIRLPWVSEYANIGVLQAGMYRTLLDGEHYWMYVFFYALQQGMLAGVLSLAAAFLSMFVSNKMMIWITPILIYQVLLEYRGDGWFGVMLVRPFLNQFPTDIQYFLTVFGSSLCFSLLFTWGICKKIKNSL